MRTLEIRYSNILRETVFTEYATVEQSITQIGTSMKTVCMQNNRCHFFHEYYRVENKLSLYRIKILY